MSSKSDSGNKYSVWSNLKDAMCGLCKSILTWSWKLNHIHIVAIVVIVAIVAIVIIV